MTAPIEMTQEERLAELESRMMVVEESLRQRDHTLVPHKPLQVTRVGAIHRDDDVVYFAFDGDISRPVPRLDGKHRN